MTNGTVASEKLVRDLIPEICAAAGDRRDFRTADPAEYMERLVAKLREEAGEVVEAVSARDREHVLEELADVQEVLLALAEAHGWRPTDLAQARIEKWAARGGFMRRLVLLPRESGAEGDLREGAHVGR